MRKIIVISMISLDGVMQAPGGPEEDTSGSFKFGGWTAPYSDDLANKAFQKLMRPADLLLGRKTFKIFESYWPKHADGWPGVMEVTKYCVSKSLKGSDWQNSVILKNIDEVKKLKKTNGSDLKVWGSSELIHSLLKNDFVDELWLVTYPVILGNGKKTFQDGAVPAAFKLIESTVTPSGVIIAGYRRAGKVKTGTVGE